MTDPADDDPALLAVRAARARLIDIELTLRDLWYDTVDRDPALSTRLNFAARLVHNATETLSRETLI